MASGRVVGSVIVISLLGVAGCGLLDPPVAAGPCALQVQTTSDDSVMRVLQPPYEMTLRPQHLLDTIGPTDINFSGWGWVQTRVTVTRPDLEIVTEIVPGEDINGGFRGWIVDEPGTWRFRLEAGACLREFAVEAKS